MYIPRVIPNEPYTMISASESASQKTKDRWKLNLINIHEPVHQEDFRLLKEFYHKWELEKYFKQKSEMISIIRNYSSKIL